MDGAEVERVFRDDYGRAVATLARLTGDVGLAEEAVQEAFAVALETWPRTGLPPSPTGWIVTTARNRAIDRARREALRDDKHAAAAALVEQLRPDEPEEVGPVRDDRLRLVFTCCHPALAPEARVALTLRLIAGLQTAQIARAFLVSETTMAQRLVRAKNKIRAAHIPYRVPAEHDLPDRLPPVLSVVYLVFNEGYLSSDGESAERADLVAESVRLARLLVELMPDEPEALGLLALMLLTLARRPARFDDAGDLVLLPDQDRTLWDSDLIAEGQGLVRKCLRRNAPGPYQLQAAISAVHSDSASAEATDWAQIVALYDHLLRAAPSPVVALNRAVAVAELRGPVEGLELVDALDLDGYHLAHAVRAELLRRTDDAVAARSAYERALALVTNPAERRHLERRLASLTASRVLE